MYVHNIFIENKPRRSYLIFVFNFEKKKFNTVLKMYFFRTIF